MSSADCSQFGPLPIYLNAAVLKLWNDPYTAPRFLCLLFGAATILPLFYLARILFGQRAAVFACLFFALDTLHVKYSSTAMAEAPFGLLFVTCLVFLFRFRRDGRIRDLGMAGVLLSLAGMVRYEGWIYVPLMGLLSIRAMPLRGSGGRPVGRIIMRLLPAVIFMGIAGLLPLVWMGINYARLGDPLWAWHWLKADHAQVVAQIISGKGAAKATVYGLLFPPGVLLLSLTPVIALLGIAGLLRSVARRETLAYAALFLPFILYCAEIVALRTFPVARFWLLPGILLLPYAGARMGAWMSGLPEPAARRRIGTVLASAAAVFAALVVSVYMPNNVVYQKLWSVSPVSPLLPEAKEVYDLIARHARPGVNLIQDSSPHTHIITFNVDARIYENWWVRPTIDAKVIHGKPATPEVRTAYLEESAPALLLLDRDLSRLSALLGFPPERAARVVIQEMHSGPRYVLYELKRKDA
jgi:4-amino-4-deoxy-L-arabinose transferase-like glycosyltransferase